MWSMTRVCGGDFDRGEAEAEGVDVPVGERVGVVGVDHAGGEFGVGVVEPVDDEVVVAGEAGVVLDGVASESMDRYSDVGHGGSIEAQSGLALRAGYGTIHPAVGKLHAHR